MKYIHVLLAALFILFFGGVAGANIVSADDDYEEYDDNYGEYGDDKGGSYEEIGELAGWGTVVITGVAGLLFPVRRLTKTVITNFPGFKKSYLSLAKNLGKYHMYIGLLALLAVSAHGIVMYLKEGRLEGEGVVGLIAAVMMFVAALVGIVLNKKRKMKSLRIAHLVLVISTVMTGIIHIAFA